jgi:hypothetical protein
MRAHLYRAVLECRLQELRGEEARSEGLRLPSSGNVGSIPLCDSFDEYARLACPRVGLPFDEPERARMGALWERHKHLERPMRAFNMLRGVFARPIERLVSCSIAAPRTASYYGCSSAECMLIASLISYCSIGSNSILIASDGSSDDV